MRPVILTSDYLKTQRARAVPHSVWDSGYGAWILPPDCDDHSARLASGFARLQAPPNAAGCRMWRGSVVQQTGYGRFTLPNGDRQSAHVVAWFLKSGEWPAAISARVGQRMEVRHTCDEHLCTAAEHLCLGTHADNMADMAARGRYRLPGLAGQQHPQAKLSAWDVWCVRLLLESGEYRGREIALLFGVSDTAISRIRRGRTWIR